MRSMSEFRHDKFCRGRLEARQQDKTEVMWSDWDSSAMAGRVVGACRPPRVRGPVHHAVNEIMVAVTWRVSGHAYTGEVRAAITSYRLVPRLCGRRTKLSQPGLTALGCCTRVRESHVYIPFRKNHVVSYRYIAAKMWSHTTQQSILRQALYKCCIVRFVDLLFLSKHHT